MVIEHEDHYPCESAAMASVAGDDPADGAHVGAARSDRRGIASRAHHLFLEVSRRPIESAQYLSIRDTERLADAGAVAVGGSTGDSYDNALAESFNGLFKTELVHRRAPWASADDLEWATVTDTDWFNNRRSHGEIGMIPPAEVESSYDRQDDAAQRAVSQTNGSL